VASPDKPAHSPRDPRQAGCSRDSVGEVDLFERLWGGGRYTFEASITTEDGHYTGLKQDNPTDRRMTIAFIVGADGRAIASYATIQNFAPRTPELHSHWRGRGPQPVGGEYSVNMPRRRVAPAHGRGRRRQSRDSKTLDEMGFSFRLGQKTLRDDSLANPRVVPLARRLTMMGPAKR
jgi:hypothetical protein